MYKLEPYHREKAYQYAQRWAMSRNPLYYNFAGIGGDCTNFVSQCLYAGCCQMNLQPDIGWYFLSLEERSPSWTGVKFFYDFIVSNKGLGPFGKETYPGGLELGDVIQLKNKDGVWYHTLIVTGFTPTSYLISAHTNDAFNRPLDTYRYSEARFIHIEGIRVALQNPQNCFEHIYDQE